MAFTPPNQQNICVFSEKFKPGSSSLTKKTWTKFIQEAHSPGDIFRLRGVEMNDRPYKKVFSTIFPKCKIINWSFVGRIQAESSRKRWVQIFDKNVITIAPFGLSWNINCLCKSQINSYQRLFYAKEAVSFCLDDGINE